MAKRIYLGRETGKYATIAGGAILTIVSLFFVLTSLGFEITGSDDFCLGTAEDPCVSYGTICNKGADNYDIYNPDGLRLDFSPTLKNYWIFFKDGRVKKQFLYDLGVNHSTEGWRYENFTNETKPRSDRVYVHRFPAYTCQEYMLVGLKQDPKDLIKWGVGLKNDYLDPFWYAINDTPTNEVSNITVEFGTVLNITTNITGIDTVCVDIDHPEYGDNYTCGSSSANFLLNISYFNEDAFSDGETSKELSYEGVYTTDNVVKNQSFNLTFNGLDNITSSNISLFGEVGSLFQDTQDAESSSGDILSPESGYDGDWGTSAFVDVGISESGTEFGNIYMNYTIPDGITQANATAKGGRSICSGCTSTIFRYGCWNYTNGSWIVDLIDYSGTSVVTQEVEIPEGCLDGDVLQTSMYIAATTPSTGRIARTRAYEDSIEWIDMSPRNISVYANDTLEAQFNGQLIGSYVYYNTLNNSLTEGNETYIQPGSKTFYIELDKDANVTSAKMNLTGHEYRGGILDSWYNDKLGYGLDFNSSGDYYDMLNFPSGAEKPEIKRYNLTTKSGSVYQYMFTDTLEVGGVIFDRTDAFGDREYCWLQKILDTVERVYLYCDTDSELLYNSPTFSLGDLSYKNSSYGLLLRENYLQNFYIFEYLDLTNIIGAISLTGSPGANTAMGIARGDTENDVWTLRYNGVDDIKISHYDITGAYQGEEFNTTLTSSNEGTALDYDSNSGIFYVISEDNKITAYGNSSLYPSSVIVDIGTDGLFEYEGSGNLTTETEIDLNATAINNYLASSSCIGVTCLVPITTYSSTYGVVEYSDINITQDVSSVTINTTIVNNQLSGTNDDSNITFSIENDVGNITVQNLSFNFLGGNDTIEIITYEQGNSSNNETLNLFYYYSNYNNSLPYDWTDDIFFLPRTNSSKNISAYGQTLSVPIYNITTDNSASDMNLSIRLNESISCLNVTWSLNGSINDSNIVNTTWQQIAGNLEYLNNTQIWLFANLENCNASEQLVLQPELELAGYCSTCVWD